MSFIEFKDNTNALIQDLILLEEFIRPRFSEQNYNYFELFYETIMKFYIEVDLEKSRMNKLRVTGKSRF